jgi:hypothetical protein
MKTKTEIERAVELLGMAQRGLLHLDHHPRGAKEFDGAIAALDWAIGNEPQATFFNDLLSGLESLAKQWER